MGDASDLAGQRTDVGETAFEVDSTEQMLKDSNCRRYRKWSLSTTNVSPQSDRALLIVATVSLTFLSQGIVQFATGGMGVITGSMGHYCIATHRLGVLGSPVSASSDVIR